MRPDQAQIDGQGRHPFERFGGVPVPKQMFDALQLLRYVGAGLRPLLLQSLWSADALALR